MQAESSHSQTLRLEADFRGGERAGCIDRTWAAYGTGQRTEDTFLFGLAAQLVGSQFPNKGSNSGPQQ